MNNHTFVIESVLASDRVKFGLELLIVVFRSKLGFTAFLEFTAS